MKKDSLQPSLRWRPLVLTYMGILSSGFVDVGRAAIFPAILASFALSQGMGAWYYSLPTLTQLLTTVLSRWWLPRFGTYLPFLFFFAAQAVSTLMIAVAGYLGQERGLSVLLLGVSIAGLNTGGMAILNNILVSDSAPMALQRRVMSGLHSLFGFACLVSPLLITTLIGKGVSWYMAIGVIGLLPLLVTLTGSFRAWPSGHQNINSARVSFRKEHFIIASIAGLYSAAEATLTSRLVLVTEHTPGWTPHAAALLLSVFYMGMLLGRSAFAALNFHLPIRKLLLGSAILSAITFVLGLRVSPVYLSVTGLMMSAFFPMLMALVNEEYKNELREVTARVTIAIALATALLHWGVGWLSDRVGVTKALYIGPVALVALVVLLLFGRHGRS